MADGNGNLTDGDERTVYTWMEERSMKCPMCQGTELQLAPQLQSMNPVNGKGLVQKTGSTFLSLGITCLSCATIFHLNARSVGIV